MPCNDPGSGRPGYSACTFCKEVPGAVRSLYRLGDTIYETLQAASRTEVAVDTACAIIGLVVPPLEAACGVLVIEELELKVAGGSAGWVAHWAIENVFNNMMEPLGEAFCEGMRFCPYPCSPGRHNKLAQLTQLWGNVTHRD
jgi:hypothetical protein